MMTEKIDLPQKIPKLEIIGNIKRGRCLEGTESRPELEITKAHEEVLKVGSIKQCIVLACDVVFKHICVIPSKIFEIGDKFVHGLICFENGCCYWSRDVNGATNIHKIAYTYITR